jgi:hypothetical protein
MVFSQAAFLTRESSIAKEISTCFVVFSESTFETKGKSCMEMQMGEKQTKKILKLHVVLIPSFMPAMNGLHAWMKKLFY